MTPDNDPQDSNSQLSFKWEGSKLTIPGNSGPASDSQFAELQIAKDAQVKVSINQDCLEITSGIERIFIPISESTVNLASSRTPSVKKRMRGQTSLIYNALNGFSPEFIDQVIKIFDPF